MSASFSARLHEAAAPIWAQCLNHPFVTGIGDGTLPREKFQYFMLQDYLYLFDYARVFALGVFKARDRGLMQTFAAQCGKHPQRRDEHPPGLYGPAGHHGGAGERREARPGQPVLHPLYADLAADMGGPAEIVAAILGLLVELRRDRSRRWRTFPARRTTPSTASGSGATPRRTTPRTNDALIELMDALADGCAGGGACQHLEEIFVNCSRYELGFWDMAWETARHEGAGVSTTSPTGTPPRTSTSSTTCPFPWSRGSFHCIIGVSGCGKSTIFRLTNGLLQPKSGVILVEGKPIVGQKHYCGYMPQKDLLFPWRTVGENLALPLEIHGRATSKAQRRELVDAALADVGLAGCRDKRPEELSGGMRQRAAFARTMLTGSDLLLLDEPFSALDFLTRISMQEWLLDQWEQHKKTILFITHDVEEAVFLSGSVLTVHRHAHPCPDGDPRARGLSPGPGESHPAGHGGSDGRASSACSESRWSHEARQPGQSPCGWSFCSPCCFCGSWGP